MGFYIKQHPGVNVSGWWFGTWLEPFFHILGIVTPTDELIFFRGVGLKTTNQISHW